MSDNIYIKLVEFKQNGIGWHNEPIAKEKLAELKRLLSPEDYAPLSMAHFDFRSGKGADYFYRVIENLISKYRQDQSGGIKKTLL